MEGQFWDKRQQVKQCRPSCLASYLAYWSLSFLTCEVGIGLYLTWRAIASVKWNSEVKTFAQCLKQRIYSYKFVFKKFIYYLFLAVSGLRFCARAFSSCGKRGPLFIAVRGPLTIAASLVAEHRLQMHRLSSCGSRAQLFRGMWDLPRPGLEPVSPALAGRLSTTAPPGKPSYKY